MNRNFLGLIFLTAALSLGLVHTGYVSIPGGLGVRPVAGPMQVVVVLDRKKSLPSHQLIALDSPAAESYLVKHAAKDSTGSLAVRQWDCDLTDEQITDDPSIEAIYAQAKADSNGDYPWVRIVAGSKFKSCKFPADEAAWLALLKSIGGD